MSCIRKKPLITKSEITRATGLTAGTVNTFIGLLTAKKLVLENGIAESTGGRRSIIYSLNPKSNYLIGVSLMLDCVVTGLYDYGMSLIDSTTSNRTISGRIENEAGKMAQSILELIRKNNIAADKVAGIGISVPGPVNYQKGVILDLPHIPGWKNVPLAGMIRENTGFPVLVDNNCNCNVLALKWNFPEYDQENMVFLSTTEGIGVGVMIGNAIYRGSRHFAGEIGHITVDPFGAECSCGNHGCIELYAANPEICITAEAQMKKKAGPAFKKLVSNKPVSMEILIQAAKSGDSFALQVLDDASRYISICVENAIKSYDPDCVALNTMWLREFPDLWTKMVDNVFTSSKFIQRDGMKIIPCDIKDLFLAGAANLVLDHDLDTMNSEGLVQRLSL